VATGEVSLPGAETLVGGALPDSGLVERCRQGDAQAFARLVALHEGMVFNLAARLTGDPEEARDVSQDVFLQVYRTLGRFEGRSSLKTWIYRIVVNHCHNRHRFWRRRKRDMVRPLEELTAADHARLAASSIEGASPYEQLRRREREKKVQQALLRLSFEHRAILLLREAEGLSVEDIASALGLPEGTVKSRLARAREALRARLLESVEEGQRP
jgi:RNA polymerase sigma-70 factor (ECF subfamily)